MSTSFAIPPELIIKPEKSKTYFRLIVVFYLISLYLLFSSSIYGVLKGIITLLILIGLRTTYANQNPSGTLLELKGSPNQWTLIEHDGSSESYEHARVLFNNDLFQLLKFTNLTKKKWILLFSDQLSRSQMRLLYLKITLK